MNKLTRYMVVFTLLFSSQWAVANEANTVTIELNKVEQSAANCRLMFLARNNLAQHIGNLSFETVLLDQQGSISRLTVLDFMDLPASKLRLRQFEFPALQCQEIKQILFNNLMTCSDSSANALSQCNDSLKLSSTTTIEVLD
jgi:hypothetical protein